MSNMLAIGGSALLAYRSALNVISNNIANANTPGYAQESIVLQAAPGAESQSGTSVSGVQVQTIERLSDPMLQQQLLTDTSSLNSAQALQSYATQVDSALSGSDTGLSAPLQTLASDLSTLSSNPTSSAARESVLADIQTVANTFQSLSSQFTSLQSQVQTAVGSTATQINGYASQLAQLNSQIAQAAGQTPGQAPNALLDQRDQLLQDLSADVSVTTSTNANGTVDVYIGSGQALVQQGNASTLSTQAGAYGQGQDVVLTGADNKGSVVTGQLSGGTLGGLLQAQQQVLQPALNGLGQLAVAVSSAYNAANGKGMTSSGSLGGALFSTPPVQVSAASTNSGSATVSAVVSSAATLTADSYVLSYGGTGWTLTDQASGAAVSLSGTGTASNPLTGAGLSLTVAGTPAAGSSFLIQPTAQAASSLSASATSISQIAVASAIQVSAGAANTGSADVTSAGAVDPPNASLLSAATITFTGANTYSINGAGSYSFTSGTPIQANGWQVTLSGTPATGDVFNVTANTAASTDGSNAAALASVSGQGVLDSKTTSIQSALSSLVTQVGTQAQQANAQVTARQTLVTQAQTAAGAVSGVNLDEQAAAMMQFQQSYEAAAQIISTSNTLFQSLISALQAG